MFVIARLRVNQSLACLPIKLQQETSDICYKLDQCQQRRLVGRGGVWRRCWASSSMILRVPR